MELKDLLLVGTMDFFVLKTFTCDRVRGADLPPLRQRWSVVTGVEKGYASSQMATTRTTGEALGRTTHV